jgi:hypothetical protein
MVLCRMKKILSFDVVFSEYEQTIETLEGPVQCLPGDAIVTGISGERWPVVQKNSDKNISHYHRRLLVSRALSKFAGTRIGNAFKDRFKVAAGWWYRCVTRKAR